MRPHSTLGGVALALAVVLTGCNDSPESRGEPTPTPPASSAPTAEPQEPEDLAKADALEALPRYFKIQDQIGRDAEVPLERLTKVAISSELAILTNQYRQQRRQGWSQVGDVRLVRMQVERVSLDNSDPEKGIVPYVLVKACIDVSEVDVVDENGNSMVSSERPDTFTDLYAVSNYSWERDARNGWKVSSTEAVEQGEPCDE